MFEPGSPAPVAPPPAPEQLLPVPGSRTATVAGVPVIPQKEIRNDVGAILRRAEAGEEFTITVSGRPVARLGPLVEEVEEVVEDEPSPWVDIADVAELLRLPAMPDWMEDIEAGASDDLRDSEELGW